MKQNTLVISRAADLRFGHAPRPLSCGREVVIGNGEVYPEINFTLPAMPVEQNTWAEVRRQYSEIITAVCQRAVDLEIPALVVEFELLPPMTLNPRWGGEICGILTETLDHFHQKYGLRSALRATPVDVRESARPPRMRQGKFLETTLQSFENCAENGADLLSIESTGGKEIHDEALLNADLGGIIFSLGVLGVRDMQFLWEKIVGIAQKHQCIAAGDTACGFANTAMVLAEKRMIPKVLAAVIRVAATVRTLQAHLAGAKGPGKDCAYEGPFLKALCGIPISMEGKSSACAHLSSLGNIAAACCDLWSNESVQNIRLLSAAAPVVSLEQLAYDCRLMNTALREGRSAAGKLQHWLIESDVHRDPQAYVLHPEVVIRISRKIAAAGDPLAMTIAAARETLQVLQEAHLQDELHLDAREIKWIALLTDQLNAIPDSPDKLWEFIQSTSYAGKLIPGEYGLDG